MGVRMRIGVGVGISRTHRLYVAASVRASDFISRSTKGLPEAATAVTTRAVLRSGQRTTMTLWRRCARTCRWRCTAWGTRLHPVRPHRREQPRSDSFRRGDENVGRGLRRGEQRSAERRKGVGDRDAAQACAPRNVRESPPATASALNLRRAELRLIVRVEGGTRRWVAPRLWNGGGGEGADNSDRKPVTDLQQNSTPFSNPFNAGSVRRPGGLARCPARAAARRPRRARWARQGRGGEHVAVVEAVEGVAGDPLGTGGAKVREGDVQELTAVELAAVRGLLRHDHHALQPGSSDVG